MAERELAILIRAPGALQTATDIGKVDTAVGKVGTTATAATGTLRTKFGQLKGALKDTNNQIGIVGAALAGLENFVPPSLRPIVQGLEDINRIAPRGIPGLVGDALANLKTITATEVTVIGKAIGGPGGLFPPVGAAGPAAGAAGTLGAGAIVGGVVIGAGAASLGLLALGKVVEATSTKEQLAANTNAFNTQQILKHSGMTLEQIRAKNLSVIVNNTNKVSISAREVVSTTTQTKVLAGGIQQI